MPKGGFKDLLVWQRAKELAVLIYKTTETGSLAKDFGLKDQMRRAAVSVPSNIAEGDERDTNKDAVKGIIGLPLCKYGTISRQLK